MLMGEMQVWKAEKCCASMSPQVNSWHSLKMKKEAEGNFIFEDILKISRTSGSG